MVWLPYARIRRQPVDRATFCHCYLLLWRFTVSANGGAGNTEPSTGDDAADLAGNYRRLPLQPVCPVRRADERLFLGDGNTHRHYAARALARNAQCAAGIRGTE